MEKMFQKISTMKGYALELQKNMTCRPAISPSLGGKGEYQKASYLEGELNKIKFDELFHVDSPDTTAEGNIRPNIIAKYYGENKNKTLWLMAHMDVVSAGDLALWKTNPFELALDNDKDTIYGRGVEDNQQAIVAALLTAKTIAESGKRPPINLGIMLLSDEEVGNEYGLHYLLKQRPDLFGKDDLFIVQDCGDPEGKEIEIAEKSTIWFKFTVTGKQCHASIPDLGINAFEAAANLGVRLSNGLRAKFNKKDPLFSPDVSTFELTKKEVGVPNVNIIPGSDIFYMDCRIFPCYSREEVEDEITRIEDEIENEFKVKVEHEVIVNISSKATPADSPLVKAYAEAVKSVNKVEPKIIGVGGGTFAADVRNLGLPAVVGSKMYSNPHGPNERTRLSFVLDDVKLLIYVLMHLK
ncbi:MAG: M20 family metallo-hydrolase [Elusimicrobiaceae bacterium]|nr:M20 family metallo-hydrolase [Elusimicrobiaceae bacterium]